MKYDDYKWHIGEDFPKDLPKEAALTHMGMFIGWIIDKGLEGGLLKEHFNSEIKDFKQRKIKGSTIVEKCCDFKITSEDLNDEANKFAKYYYESDNYFDDYANLSDDNNETIFHEKNTWEKYKVVSQTIEIRFKEWKNSLL